MSVVLILCDRLVAHGVKTLRRGLFLLCLQPLFDPFASALGKALSDRFREVIGMLASRVVEESNLLSVSATPLAEQEMDPQANSLHQGELPIECSRLKATGLLATQGQQQEDFHSTIPCFPNQSSAFAGSRNRESAYLNK